MERLAAPIAAAARRQRASTLVRPLRSRLISPARCFSRPHALSGHRRKVSTKSSLPVDPPAPPPASSPTVELSDREMLRRLLRRPHRQWYWIGGIALAGATLVAFMPELKVGVSKHTADVATKSLQDETLQSHTRELASQIVQTVLNDPKVLDQASFFIQRLVVMDATRDALRSLVVHTLNDDTTLANVTQLAKSMLALLLDDPKTRALVATFLRQTMQDPHTRDGLLKLLDEIMKDKTMQKNLAQLLAQTFATEPVKSSVATTIGESVHDVLSRPDIQNHAKQFVGSVVQDQTVQAQSGDAIWGTVMYAITPSWLTWIWAGGEEEHPQSEVAEAAAAAVTGVAAVASAQADAIVSESSEAFADAIEKRVENGEDEEERSTATQLEETADQASTLKLVSPPPPSAPAPPPSKFEMLRRLTMRLPYVSSSSKHAEEEEREEEERRVAAAAAEQEEEQNRLRLKAKAEAESYADRHWSGSSSGFL